MAVEFKLLSVIAEGIVFAIIAMGLYVSFSWMRFPDLTPDGSFVLGAAVIAILALHGYSPLISLIPAFLFGAAAGCLTAGLNRWLKVPAVVAGLLSATSLYSLTWLLLGKPNQFIDPPHTISGSSVGAAGLAMLTAAFVVVWALLFLFLVFVSNTFWGIRLRALGENPLLAHDLGTSQTAHTFVALALANGFAALGGALFTQRSYSADINMGVGVTITGLATLILGVLIAGGDQKPIFVLPAVLAGAVLYKSAVLLALEWGVPPEAFRVISSLMLVLAFVVARRTAMDVLRGLKWN